MGHRVLIVGRDRQADIRLDDPSVSRRHAELVVADGGDLHIADRASANGTWIESGGRWERIGQRTVRSEDRLRLGDVSIAVSELLLRVPAGVNAGAPDNRPAAIGTADARPADSLPRWRVRRNPRTGEVTED